MNANDALNILMQLAAIGLSTAILYLLWRTIEAPLAEEKSLRGALAQARVLRQQARIRSHQILNEAHKRESETRELSGREGQEDQSKLDQLVGEGPMNRSYSRSRSLSYVVLFLITQQNPAGE